MSEAIAPRTAGREKGSIACKGAIQKQGYMGAQLSYWFTPAVAQVKRPTGEPASHESSECLIGLPGFDLTTIMSPANPWFAKSAENAYFFMVPRL